jgi:hypothetical protein
MKNHDSMLHALSIKVPEFVWERISTGGGCTAIWGSDTKGRDRAIMITDGDASEPAGFASPACAIYYEDHERNEMRASKEYTMIGHFWELLDWLVVDVQTWNEEKTPTDRLIDRLTLWAHNIENNAITELAVYTRTNFADDLRTAIHLINTHAKAD